MQKAPTVTPKTESSDTKNIDSAASKPNQSTSQIYSQFPSFRPNNKRDISELVQQDGGRCTDDFFVTSVGTSIPGTNISQTRLNAFQLFNDSMQLGTDVQLRVPNNTPATTRPGTPEPTSSTTPKI